LLTLRLHLHLWLVELWLHLRLRLGTEAGVDVADMPDTAAAVTVVAFAETVRR
jgi:hypothetical protein